MLIGTSMEPEVEAIDPAATAWLLASMAWLPLMTPGLAIFYGPGPGTSLSRF
jgi:Amt family ammonium transporter